MINKNEQSLLIADDTVLSKTHNKKIDLIHCQYSGNAHDVIAGIGLINLLWHDLKEGEAVPVEHRIYDKDTRWKD